MNNLDGLTTGKYKITTRSGTVHILDLDEGSLTRYPAEGHEGHKIGMITADGAPFYYHNLFGVEVGTSMYASDWDGWRRSSVIESIEPM